MTEKQRIAEGYYDVKIKTHGADVTKTGKAKVWVQFENGLFWQGFFTEATMENTVRQLAIIGFNGETPSEMNREGSVNKAVTYNVQVVHETDDKGLTRAKVAWINESYKKKEITPDETKVLKGIDLRAHLKTARAELGTAKTTSDSSQAGENATPPW